MHLVSEFKALPTIQVLEKLSVRKPIHIPTCRIKLVPVHHNYIVMED